MGFTLTPKTTEATAATTSTAAENWGMGLLLVFFPDDDDNNHHSPTSSTSSHHFSSSSSSSSSPLSSFSSRIKRSNSSLISTKAQSTISICALFVFLTLLLFTLSTFEPSTTSLNTPRRFLSQKSPPTIVTAITTTQSSPFSFLSMWSSDPGYNKKQGKKQAAFPVALQGMGVLYRRGTRAVNDLVIGHVAEDTTEDEFRLFLRVLHRSGLSSKSDMAFLYGSSSSLSKFGSVVEEENDSFLKLIHRYKESNGTGKQNSALRFDLTQFVTSVNRDLGEPLWGKRIRGNNYSNSTENHGPAESTQLSYGSIVGFEVNELDPVNSLAGFFDHIPMSLRRWACYPMLLGRVRHNFKHILLVDVKKLVLLGDPLVRVRNQIPESVYISMEQEEEDCLSNKHNGKRNSDKTQPNTAILMGGARGVRRLSTAMLTEIVRASMQHRKTRSESGILSQLIANEHILKKSINLMKSTESIPAASSVSESKSSSPATVVMIQSGGNSNHGGVDDYSIIMKQICSCEAVEFSVYKNC